MLECRFFHFHFPAILNSIDDIKYSKQHNILYRKWKFPFTSQRISVCCANEWLGPSSIYIPLSGGDGGEEVTSSDEKAGYSSSVLCLVLAPASLYTTADLLRSLSDYSLLSQHKQQRAGVNTWSTLCRYLGSQQCSDLTPDRGDVIMLLVLWIQGMSVKLQYSSFFFVLKESAKTLYILSHGGVM